MASRVPIAFAAGFISFLAPCVLPLVPAYLSAISATAVGELNERSVVRRTLLASVPFILGFSSVFVLLGVGAGLSGGLLAANQRVLFELSGFIVIVFGLAFMGLLPWSERIIPPAFVASARGRGSRTLLGGAFAVCAAPCIGPVLASILVLAGTGGSAAQAALLLAVYSAGLAVPFLITGIAFNRAMGAFRWLRDHYGVIQVGSGTILVMLGLLLFFDRFWWLNLYASRMFDAL